MRILKKLGFVLLAITFLLIPFKVLAQSCEDIPSTQDRIQEKIDCLKKKKALLAAQSKTLSNQIAQFNTQIQLTELQIRQTEEKISLLGGRIDQLEVSLETLTKAFSSRASETYKMVRLGDSLIFLISAPDLSSVVSRYHYLQRIQEADRGLLVRLQEAQNVYGEEKGDQEDLQAQLEEQGRVLGVQKTAKANLLAITQNDEKKYKALLTQALSQQRAFLRFVFGQGGATILENQTKCDPNWGCYYNQRDSEWGRNSLGTSGVSVAEAGCLVSSVAMIASHYGINIKPSDIAANSEAFVGDTADLWNEFSVNDIDVKKRHVSTSLLDSELDAGRPVIAGLYNASYPEHFIVIKEKNGDNYIMHDPFLENGGNRPLSDRYNVSDIVTLRLISFH